mgnify:CR=1 FL=1
MKSTTKRAFVVFLLVAFFSAGLVYLAINLGTNAEKWATLRANTHLVNDGSFIGAGNVLDRNGVVLAETVEGERAYNNSERIRRSVLHIVGSSLFFSLTFGLAFSLTFLFANDMLVFETIDGFSHRFFGIQS